jgi:photosystem II stability/assembly factor-like uncharacterized protein
MANNTCSNGNSKTTGEPMVKLLCSFMMTIALCGHLAGREVPEHPDLHRVFFADTHSGYAIGTTTDKAVVFKSEDGGANWNGVYQTKLPLYGLYFRSADEGWVVGGSGTILYTSNGGKTWNGAKSGTDADLLAITADSSGSVFVVGTRGTVLKSATGEAWRKCAIHATVDLTNVASLPSGLLLVLGRDRLFTSSDAGTTWITHGPYKWDTFSGLAFANEKLGFLISGQLFRTTDGGNTLSWLSVSPSEHVNQVRITDASTYLLVGSAESGSTVHVPGEKLPSHSSILKGTTTGKAWEPVFQLNDKESHSAWLEDLFFIGEHGWAVGAEGTVVHTADGGKTWEPSRVKYEEGLQSEQIQSDPHSGDGWRIMGSDTVDPATGDLHLTIPLVATAKPSNAKPSH